MKIVSAPKARGFAMIELILALTISAFLAIYANAKIAQESKTSIAQGAGTYLSVITSAVQVHLTANWNLYSAGSAIPGVALPLNPTIAELQALGRLRPGFPLVMPTRQTARIDILRQNCPGANCSLTATVCTNTPVAFDSTTVNWDMANTMFEAQQGSGGQSRINDGANIRGPALNVPNPLGNVEGIVCGSTMLDTTLYNKFVLINDTRDPNLFGPLTVAGLTTLNGGANINGPTTVNNTLSVSGQATFGPCITLEGGANGRAGFGCQSADNVPSGYTGGVTSTDVVAQGNILASNAPSGFTGANGNYALITANNGAGAAEIRTSGRAAADRLTPLGSYTAGASCAAADNGSIAQSTGGSGLVLCSAGVWRLLSVQASANASCAVAGSMAVDPTGQSLICIGGKWVGMSQLYQTGVIDQACPTIGVFALDPNNNYEQLFCSQNLAGGSSRWMRLRDLTTHFVLVNSTEVTPDMVLAKPACNADSGQIAQQVIQLIPKVVSTSDGGIAVYAVDNGATWTVKMQNGKGTNLTGVPSAAAIAQIYCYFP
jgi:prepilin-type N-terminal cleavage/methylation domain-containing protein